MGLVKLQSMVSYLLIHLQSICFFFCKERSTRSFSSIFIGVFLSVELKQTVKLKYLMGILVNILCL